jgi:hypothetical protein
MATQKLEDTYGAVQQLDSVMDAIVDVIKRMDQPSESYSHTPCKNWVLFANFSLADNCLTAPQVVRLSSLQALRMPQEKAVQTMASEVADFIPATFTPYFAKSFKGKHCFAHCCHLILSPCILTYYFSVPVIYIKDRRWVLACISYAYPQSNLMLLYTNL